jgi:hypothetical protein
LKYTHFFGKKNSGRDRPCGGGRLCAPE